MWGLYKHIINLYLQDKGVIDSLIGQASVPLINFMVKAPEVFKSANFEGQGSPLNMMFAFIQKIFQDGQLLADEIHSMCAVTLIMAILEHLGDGIQDHLHQINHFYISEMQTAETNHYKNMLIQGIMMNLWYDQSNTIASLQSHQQTQYVFEFIISNIENINKDFEIKRVVIGLSALTLNANSSNLDQQVQSQFPNFLNAIVVLCQKSLVIKQKKIDKIKDEEDEEAVEDHDCEREAIFDEDDEEIIEIEESEEEYSDDEWDLEEENENELYDTKIDKIDEILYVRD
jgi:hypothetical protein